MRNRPIAYSFRIAVLLVMGLLQATLSSAQEELVRARAEQMRTARDELNRLLASSDAEGRPTAGGVEGRFIERLPGSYVFAPRRSGLPQVSVANPQRVSALAVGLLLQLKGRLDDQGRLMVESYELFQEPSSRGPGDLVAPEKVEDAASAIARTIDSAIKPGAMSVQDRTLRGSSAPAKETAQNVATIVAEYRKAIAANDDQAIRAIVDRWAKVRLDIADLFREDTQYKALYGPSDNYPPWRYGRIQQQSPAVVAVGEAGQTTSRCSGVLIASDLVLTAAHCFSGPPVRAPGELQVWFDYAEQADGVALPIRRHPILEPVAPAPARWSELLAGSFSESLLDFAIVRFGPAAGQQPGVSSAAAQPQCVRAIPLARGDAIYVVGYPRGDRVTVHDNARVYLPYRELDGDRFYQLRLDVEADFFDRPERAEVMEQFDSSYQIQKDANGLPWRYFRSVLDGFQPRMGIVADTFRGNSGGPVYDHERDQCVAGILIAGASDTGVRRNPNWREHERVLPISAILDTLRSDPATRSVVDRITVKN